MRPSQQKNRMRGRGRKQPNPMSRNFESNGPDVKIRGNASHIAEKYGTLARDAAASGDRVIAENYLQHAEHYNRIIAAAAAAANRNEENAAAGRGPQPGLSGQEKSDDTEPNRDSEQANQETSQADDGSSMTENAPDARRDENRPVKREGRRRRPKNAESNGQDEENGPESANGDGSAREDGQQISEDAAKLPGNLIGSTEGSENRPTEASQDD